MRVATYTATARTPHCIRSDKYGVLSLRIKRRDDVDTESVSASIRLTTAAAGRQQLRLVETSARTSGNRRQSFDVLYGREASARPCSSTTTRRLPLNAACPLAAMCLCRLMAR